MTSVTLTTPASFELGFHANLISFGERRIKETQDRSGVLPGVS